MTKTTDIYESGTHQMRHCNPCEMPAALKATQNPSYSLLKHVIIESREASSNPKELAIMRASLEAQGAAELFDAAQQCIRCAEGMCLLINGNELIGELAVL